LFYSIIGCPNKIKIIYPLKHFYKILTQSASSLTVGVSYLGVYASSLAAGTQLFWLAQVVQYKEQRV
jgi:hypothetical protein